MSFYSNIAATASRLITKFGATIIVKRITGETIDPITGITTAGTTTNYLTNGIYKKIPSDLIDGTRILATDKMLILDDTSEPLMTDTIDNLTIMEIIESNPAGTPLVYFVRLRK